MENTATATQEKEALLSSIRALEAEVDKLSDINGSISNLVSADAEAQKKVEHFQNQFMIQKGMLDRMKHNVKISQGHLAGGHQELAEFNALFGDLKSEFAQFSGQYHS